MSLRSVLAEMVADLLRRGERIFPIAVLDAVKHGHPELLAAEAAAHTDRLVLTSLRDILRDGGDGGGVVQLRLPGLTGLPRVLCVPEIDGTYWIGLDAARRRDVMAGLLERQSNAAAAAEALAQYEEAMSKLLPYMVEETVTVAEAWDAYRAEHPDTPL